MYANDSQVQRVRAWGTVSHLVILRGCMELTQSGRETSMEAALRQIPSQDVLRPQLQTLQCGEEEITENPVLPLLLDTRHHKEPSASGRFLSLFPTALGTAGALRLWAHEEQ